MVSVAKKLTSMQHNASKILPGKIKQSLTQYLTDFHLIFWVFPFKEVRIIKKFIKNYSVVGANSLTLINEHSNKLKTS